MISQDERHIARIGNDLNWIPAAKASKKCAAPDCLFYTEKLRKYSDNPYPGKAKKIYASYCWMHDKCSVCGKFGLRWEDGYCTNCDPNNNWWRELTK